MAIQLNMSRTAARNLINQSILWVALLAPILSVAQEDSFAPEKSKKGEDHTITAHSSANKVMLVPFETRLYNSDLDRSIARKSNLNYFQIRDTIRFALNAAIMAEAESMVQSISMLNPGDPIKTKDLEYIYNSIGYTYPIRKSGSSRSGVSKGGVRPANSKIKYAKESMELRIFNPNLFSYLASRYDAGVFLFITEFSVGVEAGTSQWDLANNMFYRTAKVNYTIFDIEGKKLTSGAESARIPSNVDDLEVLNEEYFPLLAKAVVDEVPGKALRSLK